MSDVRKIGTFFVTMNSYKTKFPRLVAGLKEIKTNSLSQQNWSFGLAWQNVKRRNIHFDSLAN